MVYILLFFLGASIGSFLNVVITRSIEGKQWKTGRSVCDHCERTLSWYDMIPVISYILYRGRSRCCRHPLSLQHPVVEILMGLLFVWWFAVGMFFFRLVTHPLTFVQPGYWLILGIILLVIAVTDLFYGLIPTIFVYVGIGVTLLYRVFLLTQGAYHTADLWLAIASSLGAASFFWFLRTITRGRGMGDGDIILAFLIGLILGWPKVTIGILSGFVIGAVISLPLLFAGVKKMKATLPFGPFMVVGALVGLVYGDILLRFILG